MTASAPSGSNPWLGPILFAVSGGLSAALVGSVVPLIVSAGALVAYLGLRPDPMPGRAMLAGSAVPETLLDRLDDADRKRVLELERVRFDVLDLIDERSREHPDLWAPERQRVEDAFAAFLRLLERHVRNARFLEQTSGPARPADDGGSGDLQASQSDLQAQLENVERSLYALRDHLASSEESTDIADSLEALHAGVSAVEAAESETRRLLTRSRRLTQ